MAQRFPSIALLGATGNLGPHLLSALRSTQPPFTSITVLTRSPPSPSTFPPDITIKTVDYTSPTSLLTALAGIDAIVSALPIGSVPLQHTIIDAAVQAGVKFFIPSEFGLASTGERINKDFDEWRGKAAIAEKLKLLKEEGKIDYTLIFTGLFLDWGMEGFLLDLKRKKISIWDEGNTPISLTTVGSIGKAVEGVLEGRVEGKEEVRVRDVNISQRRLWEVVMEVVGEEGWVVEEWDTEEGMRRAEEKQRKGERDRSLAGLKRAVVDGGYGSLWGEGEDNSEALGLRAWEEEDVKTLVRGMVENGGV